MIYSVILHIDSPLQSWGTNSRFQHRSAGYAPSKSAICGMICAACGVAKQSTAETEIISAFAEVKMDCYTLKSDGVLTDYHTVQNFRRARGAIEANDAVLTYRQYWQSARYNVVLSSKDYAFICRIHAALQSPVWGVWFGRKCCIPAAPIIQEPVMAEADAKERAGVGCIEIFAEADDYASGTDTWFDAPQGFGTPCSSGREGRLYAPRRINHFIHPDSGDRTEFFKF